MLSQNCTACLGLSCTFGILAVPGPRYNVSLMRSVRYTVQIGEACCIGSDMPYEMLVVRLMEFIARAAIAKSADQSVREHEELRKHGIGALQVWYSAAEPFQAPNELNSKFYARLDRDLRARWRRLGYHTESLRNDMKALFSELEQDATQMATEARERLLADFCKTLQEMR